MLTRRQRFDAWVAPALGGILAALARLPLIGTRVRRLGPALIAADEVERADLLVVLGGGTLERATWAATLYHQGYAPRVLVFSNARPRALAEAGVPSTVAALQRDGVPESAILHLAEVANTAAEACALRDHLTSHGLRSAIVVTEAYHSRRARRIFRRTLAGAGAQVSVTASPASRRKVERWWLDRSEAARVAGEWVGLTWYWLRSKEGQ